MPKLARAFIGNREVHHTFAFNPQTVEWNIHETTQSFDTLGGRVVQLLSVGVDDMTINGQAGSRAELRKIASDLKDIAVWQARNQLPVDFKVPSRGWDFKVYIRNMPRIGFEVTTVDYSYQIGLAIDEAQGLSRPNLVGESLKRIAKGIGFNTDWHGGDLDMIRRLYSGYNTTGASAPNQNIFGNQSTSSPIPKGNKPSVPTTGTLTDVQLVQLAYWALSTWASSNVLIEDTKTAVAIALCESGGRTDCGSDGYHGCGSGSNVNGLWQNDNCSGAPTGRVLWNPYTAAEWMAKQRADHIGQYGWQCWGCGPDHKGQGYVKFLGRAQKAIDKAFK